MAVDVELLSRREVFSNQSIDVGAYIESGWYPVHEFFMDHGLNLIFAGSGTLKVEYKTAAIPDDDYGSYTTALSGAVVATDSPSELPLALMPSALFIKYKATETSGTNGISGLYMLFVQTGGRKI